MTAGAVPVSEPMTAAVWADRKPARKNHSPSARSSQPARVGNSGRQDSFGGHVDGVQTPPAPQPHDLLALLFAVSAGPCALTSGAQHHVAAVRIAAGKIMALA